MSQVEAWWDLADLILSSERDTQYTGPGHGLDAHVADRAR